MKHIRLLSVLFVVMALLAASGPLRAQDITGSIAGTVQDSTGAVVADATVTITNTDTGLRARTVRTNGYGEYSAPLLQIGHYSVTVEAKGFKKTSLSRIELNVAEVYRADVTLQVGSVDQMVTVEAAPLQVETETATNASLITGEQVRELSLNNRNYEQLVSLSPGVSYGGGDQLFVGTTNPSGQTNVVSFSINGQRTSANYWTVDGADNVDRGSNLTLLNYPSVEAIAEFKIVRNIYSAEFGRAASGNVNVVTRSGAKDWRGNAYEFVRNDYFNANTYINNSRGTPRPPLRYNDFGWTFGGPVIIPGLYNPPKDSRKTFFFFSQEFRRQKVPANVGPASVPTAQEKQGIFTKTVCTALIIPPNPPPAACPAGSTGPTVAAINPIAQQYLAGIFSKLPGPFDPVTHQLFSVFQSEFKTRQELVRVDHVFGPRWSVFGRFLNDSIPTKEPGGLFPPPGGGLLPGVANTSTNSPGRSWVFKSVNTFSPTFVMEAGYAYSYGAIISRIDGNISSAKSSISPTLPFTVSLGRVPSLSFTNGASTVTGFGPYDDFNRNHNVFANLSKQFGRHILKFGFSYNHY